MQKNVRSGPAASKFHGAPSGADMGAYTLKILTWNVDGLKGRAKKLAVETYLWEHQVDVAVLTETHLIDEDMVTIHPTTGEHIPKITMSNYIVANWHNRESEVGHKKGGVAILVKNGIDFRTVPQQYMPLRPLSCCSVVIEAVCGRPNPFRISGIYFPPPPACSQDVHHHFH